jgi:type I restriction enzyme S subunit
MKILSARPGYSLKFMYEVMSLIKFDALQHKRYWIAEYQHLKIPVPSLSEQQKIADCLFSLDELITLETQKLEALKAHKKGLMQQLFPQEVKP